MALLANAEPRGPIARLLAADQLSSIIINGQQSRSVFDLRRQFAECLGKRPGLGSAGDDG